MAKKNVAPAPYPGEFSPVDADSARMQADEGFRARRPMRAQFGDRLAVLGYQDGLASSRDFVHQREAFRLEFGRLNRRHSNLLENYDQHYVHGHR